MKIDLIDRAQLEILNKRGPRYHLQDAEKDYFLAIVLSMIYESKLKTALVFKGGTAVYHCYLEQIRFSKDLDFTAKEALAAGDLEALFSGGGVLTLKRIQAKKYSITCSIQYRGALAHPDTIEVDINTNQRVILKPKQLTYRNFYGVRLTCPVMDEREIFAEKIRTLSDRARPRDPYDLVLLKRKFGLSIQDGLALLSKKEMYQPIDKSRVAENLRICEERFEDEMAELYYREPITKAAIKELSDEILVAL
jgi:predicted nucleotidyltransferase component of viral defense system